MHIWRLPNLRQEKPGFQLRPLASTAEKSAVKKPMLP
jgi:hypothetical protein